MNKDFDINTYLKKGISDTIKGLLSFKSPKTAISMAKFAVELKKKNKIREEFEQNGTHIPAFLIASIANKCNLHCKGCYARANNACIDEEDLKKALNEDEWEKIFDEATKIGIGFILLAGGEPLTRIDVIKKASLHKDIIFPVFTNGTMFYEKDNLALFEDNRNLIPIISIEGNEGITDSRRGNGIYNLILKSMDMLSEKRIVFGASVTVTNENYKEVLSDGFVSSLYKKGCKSIIYVEYVPVDDESYNLAVSDNEREYIEFEINRLRDRFSEMLFLSFPGDEKNSGGCLAAGRGFFHINAFGGAEPCPFSPYSDINVCETSILKALKSPLFMKLKENGHLDLSHLGGCALFNQKEKIEEMVSDK